MDQTDTLTARAVVNEWPQEELRRILWQYGEERYAPAVAGAIVRARDKRPIETTLELVEVVKGPCPCGPAGETAPGQADLPGHPHRRQRRAGLGGPDGVGGGAPAEPRWAAGGDLLPLAGGPYREKCPGGFRQGVYLSAGFSRLCVREEAPGEAGQQKPIVSGAAELEENPRARSAKLRVAEKL